MRKHLGIDTSVRDARGPGYVRRSVATASRDPGTPVLAVSLVTWRLAKYRQQWAQEQGARRRPKRPKWRYAAPASESLTRQLERCERASEW